ncbi:MAG: LPS export ABC transporter periplasmic protein LptC [Bdellovibrionota bacterium]
MSRRNSFILGLLFVILVVEILIVAPKEVGVLPANENRATTAPAQDKAGTGQVMRDVHLVEAKESGKEWELWADRAVRPQDNEQWTIEKVKVKFFAANGVTYTVTGLKGKVQPDQNAMRIEGDVETHSSNGYVFKTQVADYSSKDKKLMSPGAVEMIGPRDNSGRNIHLTGADLVADLASNEININRNVNAKKPISKPGEPERIATIQSQRAVFSGRSSQAHFFGNVVIDVDTMQVSGPQAKFDFDSKTDALSAVQVAGGVKVTDTDKFATSGTVSMSFRDNKLVFKGSPRVVQNGDELVGDEITFLDGGKRVEVSNAKAQIDPKSMEKRQ